MKKIENHVMDGFMKKFMGIVKLKRTKRIAAAAVAILLAAAVVMTSVLSRTEAAENADTLMGIEKLRNRMADGDEYVILEIVPDRNAAEIGYLFDGYEPALSEWDSDKLSWNSWKDLLCGMPSSERANFIEDKKKALQDYYDAQNIQGDVPVTIPTEAYEESEEYKDGFEEVEASSYDLTGYFVPSGNFSGKYNVSFTISRNPEEGKAYYYAAPREPVTQTSTINDDTYIYRRDGELYQCVGTWGQVRDNIFSVLSSGNDEDKDDGRGDGGDKNPGRGDENGGGNEDGTGDDNGDDGNEGGDGGNDDPGGEGGDNGDGGNENPGGEGGDNGNSGDNGNGGDNGDIGNPGDNGEGGEGGNGDGGNENPGGDNGNADDNSGAGGSGNSGDNGNNGGGESGSNAGGGDTGSGVSESPDTNTNVSQAVGKALSKIKWLKFVSADDESGNNSGSAPSTEPVNAPDNGSGNQSGDSGNTSGDNAGNGSGENPDGNTGNGSDENPDGNTGNGSEENPDGNTGNGSDENPDDNTGNNPDGNPDDEGNDNPDSDKNPGNDQPTGGNSHTQAQGDQYFLVDFTRVPDMSSLSNAIYEVKEIKHSKFGSYADEEAHNMGQFDFVEAEGGNTQTYTFPGRVLYCKGVFHSNEWFKHYVLNMSKENFKNFKVRVITLTPGELNYVYESDIMPDFDFLYLNSGLRAVTSGAIVAPSDNEGGTGDSGDNGSGDGTGDNGDNGNGDGTGDNGDNGNGDGTGDSGDSGDGTGENGDSTGENGDNGNSGNNGETGDNGNGDNNGETSDNGNGDGTGDNGETGDSGNNGRNSETNNNGNTGNSSNSGTGNAGSSDNSVNTGNASDSNKETGSTGNGNEINTASKVSAWRTYVSRDDADTTAAPDSKTDSGAKTDAGETSARTEQPDNTDASQNPGNTDNNDTPQNSGNKDDDTTQNPGGNKDDDTTQNPANPDDDDASQNPGTPDDDDASQNPANPDDDNKPQDPDTPDDDDKPQDPDAPDNDDTSPKPEKPLLPSGGNDQKTSSKSIVVYNTGNNDLEGNVVNYLFSKISAGALPCLVDGSILYGKAESGAITDKGSNTENTEIFRLAAMLCQETLEKDYTGVSKTKLLEGIKDADKNFTTEQVYCRLGNGSDSIVNDSFFKYTIYKEGGEIEEGFQNVLDEIVLENLYRESDSSGSYKPLSTNISQAEAVRHILNYQNRRKTEAKKSIKVLEIQPAYTTEPELTKKQIQKWAPGVEEVETTIMTTAEFIGKIDKLNEIYDLIYIGTSKEHLNLKNWVTDTGKSKDGKYLGSTVFNDHDMDGLIYYNVGDKRVVNLPLSGLLDSEYKNGRTFFWNFVRYSGNDITKEKKDALMSFLNGSYPIIVSDEFIEQPATVFENENFAGRRATLAVGEYKEKDLLDNQVYAAANTPTKGISSIQVKKGYQVTLFAEDNFEGARITISSDAENLTNYTNDTNTLSGQTWNNRCRSMIVEKIEDAQPVRKIDGNHIDNSSYLYELVNTAMDKKYTNFYVRGDIDETGSELFKFYLNRPKARLIEFTANGLKGAAADVSSQVNDVYYIYPNTIGRYTLQYSFAIQNEGAASMDTRYNCKLYIDVNADGKFSEFEEVSDIVMTNRQTGGTVSTNELYAGVPYMVAREVPNGYKGLLPWKVEVCQVNNDNIYASEQGYTKLNGMDKETLKICQINKNTDNELKVIDLNYEINTKGRYFNTLVYGGDYGGVHYPGITSDFELDVETIDISTFEKHYTAGDPTYNTDYLDGFNMLILGFSDAYDDFTGDYLDGDTPLGAVVEFINSGKSVLMAHDTTSYFNNPIVDGTEQGYIERNKSEMAGVSNKRFAANINKFIRPLVGMDRYGVLSSPTVKRGVALKDGASGWSELFTSGKDVAYKPKSARKETVPEAQGYTYAIINVRDHDKENKVVKDFTKYNLYSGDYNNREGFSNEYVSQRFDNVYYDDNNKDNGEINPINTSGKVKNVKVTQVNKGQITEYPYKLQEEFEVAQTHAQYYQLDYTADDDGDGQSDLVVWYCLGGRNVSSADARQTIYSQSPNDVRNNYYIYNKGNITYTGMGHGANDKKNKDDNLAYTFEEAKLFINTIIASYQAGVKPPTITVLESGLPEAAQLTTMYRYYDEQNMISLADEANNDVYEKVYFTVRDINFVKGSRVIESHAYYHIDSVGGSETISVDGEEIAVNRLADDMFDAAADTPVDAGNLISGNIYYILVPKTILGQCENGLDIYFEAQSTITTNTTTQNVYTTDKVYAKLQVFRAYLFELD